MCFHRVTMIKNIEYISKLVNASAFVKQPLSLHEGV